MLLTVYSAIIIFFDYYNICLFELNNISLQQFYHKKNKR